MKVTINDKPAVTSAASVAALAEELRLPEKGIALAIDNKLVPRTEWAATGIEDGASIVIIKAFCGG